MQDTALDRNLLRAAERLLLQFQEHSPPVCLTYAGRPGGLGQVLRYSHRCLGGGPRWWRVWAGTYLF